MVDALYSGMKGTDTMKYELKRKAKKSEIKHLTKALGFEMTDTYVVIPEEYSGVVRMYKEDGLI